jgi:hypothetical protein
MPYIKQEMRNALADEALFDNIAAAIDNPGELNYVITLLLRQYFKFHSNYQGINDIIGALEGAKLEFYRRVAAPYEDEKIKLNGDVY